MVIGCVVVNFHKEKLTRECVVSLAQSADKSQRIQCVVVDNGSVAQLLLDDLDSEVFGVQIIRPRENIGFASACNLAAQMLLDQGVDYILLINNDAVVGQSSIRLLLEVLLSEKKFCAVTGRISYAGSPKKAWYAGAKFSKWTGRVHHETLDSVISQQHVASVPFISGCCMLIRSDVIRRYGLFRGGFFAYCEDLDWCLRVRQSGLELGYVENAAFSHQPSSSFRNTGGTLPLAHFVGSRNQLFVIRSYFTGVPKLTAIAYNVTLRLSIAMAFFLVRKPLKAKALLLGVRQGLFDDVPAIGEHYDSRSRIPSDFFVDPSV